MVNKVDIAEVLEFKNDLKTTSAQIKASIENIKTNIQQIDDMDSFSGFAAKNAKDYFWTFHKNSVLEAFEELHTDLFNHLNNHSDSFNSNVDSSDIAIVQSDYLEDLDYQIDLDYQKLDSIQLTIKRTINSVSDITSAGAPTFYDVTNDKKEVEKLIENLDSNLASFTREGSYNDSRTKSLIERIEKTLAKVGSVEGESRFKDHNFKEKADNLKDFLGNYALPTATGSVTSLAIAKAAKDNGLSVTEYKKNGKTTYRINASEDALRALGVEPDMNANRALQQSGKTGNAKAPINYYDKGQGKQIYSSVGEEVINKHRAMMAYNDKATTAVKWKNVGEAAKHGALDSIKELNPNGILKSGLVKGATKAGGIFTAGLTGYSNYNDALADGLTGGKAVGRAAVDTTIDTVVGGTVQVAFTAAGTAFIPIPGVGTALGAIAGIGANVLLNTKFGKSKKSIMDRAKDGFHKLTGWFS
ncbi:T7SS effector LXG polymorphic toxin [Gracilibacillus kekensis]|uniref:LXG domain of WXG superfamily protein n=1 Tax=Gracilibacillus kekensis TaxID=1027249 RepID=A0A1M7JPM8_9BACI|nr:T7SS effector LXG polymorphic toxin [Gracilibacillus kekensis]SHM54865.1 LXG domain of WXG superfamily protein [Gracilibacillus kekensis]